MATLTLPFLISLIFLLVFAYKDLKTQKIEATLLYGFLIWAAFFTLITFDITIILIGIITSVLVFLTGITMEKFKLIGRADTLALTGVTLMLPGVGLGVSFLSFVLAYLGRLVQNVLEGKALDKGKITFTPYILFALILSWANAL